MNVRARNGIYEIEIPPSYSYKDDGDTLTIYNDTDGIGAISITGYHIPKDYGFVSKDELQDFIQSIDSSTILDDNDVADCTTEYCCTEFNNNRYWRVWVLFSNNRAVFVSYNCDNADKYVEKDAINGIVKSIGLTAC